MEHFSFVGPNWCFPWFLFVIPILFFIGMAFFIWRIKPCCCGKASSEEIAMLRQEIDELKKK